MDDFLYLSDVSPRDKPWDKHRAECDSVGHLYELTEFSRYAERMGRCSGRLGFAWESSDSGEVRLRLREARFCRCRHCPVCQWRRCLMWLARFLKAMPALLEEHSGCKFILLTLTVRNCEVTELRATLDDMNRSWTRLTKLKVFPALGWVKSVEVTRSHDGTAHPHFHCLLMVDKTYFTGRRYLSQSRWSELWQQSMRLNYTPIVDVRKVKDGGLHGAVCEVVKYAVKPSDLASDSSWLEEVTRQLHKTRAIALGGCLREFLRDDEPEDLIHAEGDEDLAVSTDGTVISFDWKEQQKRYRASK